MRGFKYVIENKKIEIWSLIVFIFCFLVIYYIYRYTSIYETFYIRFNGIRYEILILLLAVALTLVHTNKKYKKYVEENNNLKAYVNTIDDFNAELRRFKHNYLNMLSTLYGYIQDEDNEDLKKYFLDIVEQCKEVKDNNISGLTNLKDVPLKSLMAVKINEALKHNILIETYCDKNVDINNIKLCDLCEILGVFLDNSIEECKKITDKTRKISICIVKIDDSVVIEIKNTYNIRPNVLLTRCEGYSTKGKGRGFGIPSVLKIIDKYNTKVSLNTYIDEDKEYFIQELCIKE